MDESSSLVVDAGVFGADLGEQVTFNLVSDHLDDIGQVLAFCGEFDDSVFGEFVDFDASWNFAALLQESIQLVGDSGKFCFVLIVGVGQRGQSWLFVALGFDD